MKLTKKEIVEAYMDADDKERTLEALAQLIGVTRGKIIRVLIGEGVDLSSLPTVGAPETAVPEPAEAPELMLDKVEPAASAKEYAEKKKEIKQYLKEKHLRASWVCEAINAVTGAGYSQSRVSHALSLEHGRNNRAEHHIVDVACAVCGLDKAKAEAER